MHKYLRRLSFALAVLPLIAGTALASGPTMFVCRGDSIPRLTCCCPESQHRAPGQRSAPTLSSACCCDIAQVSVPTIPAVLDSEAPAMVVRHDGLAPAPHPAIVAPASPAGARPVFLLFLLAQPPPHAVPILVSKQSLLI